MKDDPSHYDLWINGNRKTIYPCVKLLKQNATQLLSKAPQRADCTLLTESHRLTHYGRQQQTLNTERRHFRVDEAHSYNRPSAEQRDQQLWTLAGCRGRMPQSVDTGQSPQTPVSDLQQIIACTAGDVNAITVHHSSDDTVGKGDRPCQWETQIFRPPGNKDPWTGQHYKLDMGDYVRDITQHCIIWSPRSGSSATRTTHPTML